MRRNRHGPVPPREWPLAGFAARPGASHLDGTRCARCTARTARNRPNRWAHRPGSRCGRPSVRTGSPIPIGRVADHLAWLDGEGYDTDLIDGDPAEVIDRWLTEHAPYGPADRARSTTAEARVYVVAGGDMVAVFDNPDAAGIQRTVMEAAGLDTIASAMTPGQWDIAREILRAEHPDLVISDVRPDATGQTA